MRRAPISPGRSRRRVRSARHRARSGVRPARPHRRARVPWRGRGSRSNDIEGCAIISLPMTAFLQDLRYATRTLRRTAALSLVIVASLAIGVGANTAIFSVVNALLLKPLPYPEPDRLAVLWLRSPGINIPQDWPSPGQYIDVRTENHSFDEMSISLGRPGTLLTREEAQRVEGIRTSSSLFRMLGAQPLYGRLLRADEDTPGQPAVVI